MISVSGFSVDTGGLASLVTDVSRKAVVLSLIVRKTIKQFITIYSCFFVTIFTPHYPTHNSSIRSDEGLTL